MKVSILNCGRNGMIDLLRFVFCILIVLQHSSLFRGQMIAGYIGVEFFFLVSGWLLAEKMQKANPIPNIFHKINSFYIEFCLATLISALLLKYFGIVTDGRSHLLGTINDLLVLQTFGFTVSSNTGVMWYLTVMLASYHLLLYLVCRFEKSFIYVFIPLIVLVIYGGISYKYHTINVILETTLDGFLLLGMLRGFAGMSLGVLLHEGSIYLRKINFTKLGKILLSTIEVISYILMVYIAVLIKVPSDWDYIMIMLCSIGVMITFSELSIFYSFFQKHVCNLLGKLSLNVFLNHYFIALIILKEIPDYPTSTKMIYYFVGIIVCTCINYYLANILRVNLYSIKNRLIERKM